MQDIRSAKSPTAEDKRRQNFLLILDPLLILHLFSELYSEMFPSVKSKIDVHHHVYPPVYSEALKRNGGDPSGWFVPQWTLEADYELCEKIGVQTAILSSTAPGPDIEQDPKDAQALARSINEFNARVRDTHPQDYGFFASTPDPRNTEAALEEIRYALDILHADGVVLFTRYGDGNYYLGHEAFTPIWDFLNSRQAVVFVHPTHGVDKTLVNSFLPLPAYDYPHETGRTAIDMITSNMLRNHASNCRIILSHAGGDLPYLIDRAASLLESAPASFNPGKSREEMLAEARWFYFDTALSSSPMNLRALMALLGEQRKDHILFGSDFPNAGDEAIEYFTRQLEGQDVVDASMLGENAMKLFPRLRQ